MIHTKKCIWELVYQMYEFGLSISYKCVLEISNEIGNNICQYYKTQKQSVCPPQFKGRVSTTAHDSFHGTGISLFQHPDINCPGGNRDVTVSLDFCNKGKRLSLPEVYTVIQAATLIRHTPPSAKEKTKKDLRVLLQAMLKELTILSMHFQILYSWLEHVRQVLDVNHADS